MRVLSVFLFAALASSAYPQDSVEVHLTGQVLDTVQNLPQSNIGITIQDHVGHIYKTHSDSLGNYTIVIIQPKGKLALNLYPSTRNSGYFQENIDTTANTNLTIQQDVRLLPQKICWDSFLPSPITFDRNKATLPDDTLSRLVTELRYVETNLTAVFETNKLKISAFRSYDENKKASSKRLQFIYALALENGIKKENIILEDAGKNDLFLCHYCDGCHYSFLKGNGKMLSKREFQEINDLQEKQEYNELRRTVLLEWVRK